MLETHIQVPAISKVRLLLNGFREVLKLCQLPLSLQGWVILKSWCNCDLFYVYEKSTPKLPCFSLLFFCLMHFRRILETTAALSSSRCKYSQLSSCFCTRIAHHRESLEVFFTTADTTHCFFHGKIPRGASRPSRLTFCSITVWIIAVKRKYNFAASQKPFFTTPIKEEWFELYWNIKKPCQNIMVKEITHPFENLFWLFRSLGWNKTKDILGVMEENVFGGWSDI